VTTAIAIFVVVIVVLFVLSKGVNSINKSTQKLRHRNRCVACGARLKAVNGVYAGTCRKCGHLQAWAVKPANLAAKPTTTPNRAIGDLFKLPRD